MSEKVGYRLRNKNLKGKTIHLKLRYQGFETVTRNKTLRFSTSNTEVISDVVKELFKNNYQYTRRVRLLGVGISGFADDIGRQLSLFEQKQAESTKLDELEDLIKARFGKSAIGRAEGLAERDYD